MGVKMIPKYMIRGEGDEVYLTPLDGCSPRILMVALKNSSGWDLGNLGDIHNRVGEALVDLVRNGRLVWEGVWKLDGDPMEVGE